MRSLLVALAIAGATATAPLTCGIATNQMPGCPACVNTLLSSGAKFFWNWDTHTKIDETFFTPAQKAAAAAAFVPMAWGQDIDDDWAFLKTNPEYVLGFNEPDQYGPACVGSWNPPAYGCGPGEYRQATSSGWFPLFDPSTGNEVQPHAARFWQWTVNNMTSRAQGSRTKIVSPSMAQGADPGPSCIGVDPSLPGNPKTCPGWLNVFKQYTMNLTCTGFDGKETNCWDVQSALQIHAYARKASDILAKVAEYGRVFADDFAGTGGRTPKTLWLTEVAAGSANETEVLSFIDELMDPATGLGNRTAFGFLSHISWFSNYAFDAFTIDNIPPRTNEVWSSSAIEPFGALSPIGAKFFSYC